MLLVTRNIITELSLETSNNSVEMRKVTIVQYDCLILILVSTQSTHVRGAGKLSYTTPTWQMSMIAW